MKAVLCDLFLLVLWAITGATICIEFACAEEIFSWQDESGTMHYSTTPESDKAKATDLPVLNRENLNEKIETIKNSVPPTCIDRGGVDCSAGKDVDGSVICADRFRDSVEPFVFACLEAKLKVREMALVDVLGKTIKYQAGQNMDMANSLVSLVITLRNTAAVEAYGIAVSVPWKFTKQLPTDGPTRIDGYGVGEYTLAFNRDVPAASVLKILRERPLSVACTNCR